VLVACGSTTFEDATWKKKNELRGYKSLQRSNGARKIVQTDSGLVKIHYSNFRILFSVREGIPTRSRSVEAPVAFFSLSPRYAQRGVPFITQSAEIFRLHSTRGERG